MRRCNDRLRPRPIWAAMDASNPCWLSVHKNIRRCRPKPGEAGRTGHCVRGRPPRRVPALACAIESASCGQCQTREAAAQPGPEGTHRAQKDWRILTGEVQAGRQAGVNVQPVQDELLACRLGRLPGSPLVRGSISIRSSHLLHPAATRPCMRGWPGGKPAGSTGMGRFR